MEVVKGSLREKFIKGQLERCFILKILMDCVARKRMQKTTSKYLKWFSGYCDLIFYMLLIFMSSSMTS